MTPEERISRLRDEPLEMEMSEVRIAPGSFKASSPADLSDLSVQLCRLPAWFVLAHVHDLGLMKCRQQPLAFMIWLVKRLRGTPGMLAFFGNLNVRSREAVVMWFADTLHHLHFGEDGEDSDSAGGWSQREIDLLIARLPLVVKGRGR